MRFHHAGVKEEMVTRLRPLRIAALVGSVGIASIGLGASAASAEESGFTTRVFATGGTSHTNPDDITLLDGNIFVAWQNGIGSKGQPNVTVTDSTVIEYSRSGQTIHSWQLTGKVDGMSADAEHSRIIATVNEDGNSSLYVITLKDEGSQVTHYTYSGLTHGGGTDAPHMYRGQLFITASAPDGTNPHEPAVYRATLSGTSAQLSPVLYDDSSATIANPGGGTASLALTDPDSNTVVPGSSPRFGHDFMLDSQGEGQLIFARNAGTSSQSLFVLNLSPDSGPNSTVAVDDTAWATSSRGTLYATNGSSTVYAISGRFDVGTAFVAVSPNNANVPPSPGVPSWLATLNLNNGALSHVPGVSINPKGLLFVAGETSED